MKTEFERSKDLGIKLNLHTIGIFLPSIIFILNPLLGILLAIYFVLQYKFDSNIINLIILISIFLGLINTTKIVESDMLVYNELFQYAKKTSVINYASEFSKEPVYYLLTYILSRGLNMSFKLFVFLQTVLAYILFLLTILKFQKKINSTIRTILFSIFIGSLFFELFSLSAHLMRQFLATSILLYYIVEFTLYNKNKWWLLIISIFTHSTVYLFLPFIFLPVFKEKLKIKSILILIFFIIPLFFFYESIISFMASKLPTYLGYVFMRLGEGNFEDLTGSVKTITLTINIITLVFISYYYFFSKNNSSGLYHFLNIQIGLIIFTLLVIDLPLISYRYSFYIYYFLPFIIPLILQMRLLKPFSTIMQILILSVLLFRFGYKLEYGTFTYESIGNIILKSSINYLY